MRNDVIRCLRVFAMLFSLFVSFVAIAVTMVAVSVRAEVSQKQSASMECELEVGEDADAATTETIIEAKTEDTTEYTTPTDVLTDRTLSDKLADECNDCDLLYVLDKSDVEMLARLIYGEARGVQSKTERAAIVWCVLNRVDATGYACGGDIEWVITFPEQFHGYNEDHPVTSENIELATDVLMRWYAEKAGDIDVGRVLPEEYLYFVGDGKRNNFSIEWMSCRYYDWSLDSPYED